MNSRDLRLPTLVGKVYDQLVDDFRAYGLTVPFDGSGKLDTEDEGSDPELPKAKGLRSDFGQLQSQATKTPTTHTTWPPLLVATYSELANLSVYKDNYCPNDTPIATSPRSWIKSEYRAARGYKIERTNMSILPILWRTQSQNWTDISVNSSKKS